MVVEAIDVVDDASGRVFVALIGLSADLLRFIAFEKAFHRCVVVTVTFTAHTLQAVAPEKTTSKLATGKLRAAIAVEDQASFGAAKCDGLIERRERQLRVDGATGGPADDLSGEEILNGAKVGESFERVNVSEVCEPDEVRLLRNEYLVQTVWSDRRIVLGISRRDAKLGLGPSPNSRVAHQHCNGVFRAGYSSLVKFASHTWTAIVIEPR